MEKLILSDLIPVERYERERQQFMARIMALKARRRLRVEADFSFLFENRDTVLF